MKKIFSTLFILSAILSFSQDIHFSQFDETPLQLNPSNAGLQYETRANINYKSQWQSVNAPFKTMAASFDKRFLKKKKHQLGVGVDFFKDDASNSSITSIQANASINAIINIDDKSKIAGGLMVGFAQRSVNTGGYTWGNQYNGVKYDGNKATGENIIGNSLAYLDLGAGIQYSFGSKQMYVSANDAKRVNIGFSVFHPNRPSYTFTDDGSRLYMKFVFHGDASLGIPNSNVVLKPSYIVFKQGPSTEITPGMQVQYVLGERSKYTRIKKFTAFTIGAYYRAKDAVIALAKFEFAGYSVGLSYDVNLSKLRTVSQTRGGFELSLRMGIPRQPKGSAGASRLGIFS